MQKNQGRIHELVQGGGRGYPLEPKKNPKILEFTDP